MAGQGPEQGREPGADPLGPRLLLGRCAEGRFGDVLDAHLIGGGEAVLLVGEVLVEGAPREPGALGDRGDRRLVVAALGDRFDDRRDQALALVLHDHLPR